MKERMLIVILSLFSLCLQAQQDSASVVLNHLYRFEWNTIHAWQKKTEITYREKLVRTYCYWWLAITSENKTESLKQCGYWADEATAEARAKIRKESHDEDLFYKMLSVIMKARVENLEGNRMRSALTLRSIANDCIATLGKEEAHQRFLMTSGLYYYFMAGVESKYGYMKPFLKGYPKGDRTKGLALLSKGSTELDDPFLATECMYILMRIYMEENNHELAHRYAGRLVNMYPSNALFVYYFNKSRNRKDQPLPMPACKHCTKDQQAYIRKLAIE